MTTASTTTTTTATMPPVREEAQRRADLLSMKRRATGLLILMTAAFLALTLTTEPDGWTGYLRAATEAAMVGGLADWFAVTALFRHPLGIPIPHTAVIRERKEQFGRTLGEFVQQNFLSPDVITQRVRAAGVTRRAATWMAEREHARMLAAYLADVVVGFADVVKDEDVQRVVHAEIARGVEAVPLAPLAGRALRVATADHHHQALLDAVLRGVRHTLTTHEPMLRAQFEQQSPWWLPGALEDRVFDRLLDGVQTLIDDVEGNPEHAMRAQLDTWLEGVIERLETSPDLLARGEDLKRDLLAHPQLRAWSSSLWLEIKTTLREQAADPDSELRRRLTDAIVATGRRLCDDPALSAKADEVVELGVRYIAEHFHDEVADLVSGTIARWDGEETSDKLELLLGRDLQFIRINGTVVGGLAGVAIHGIADLLT